jgi:hypothetical protein
MWEGLYAPTFFAFFIQLSGHKAPPTLMKTRHFAPTRRQSTSWRGTMAAAKKRERARNKPINGRC